MVPNAIGAEDQHLIFRAYFPLMNFRLRNHIRTQMQVAKGSRHCQPTKAIFVHHALWTHAHKLRACRCKHWICTLLDDAALLHDALSFIGATRFVVA